jgi:putative SOS response-associated peptidase YedK
MPLQHRPEPGTPGRDPEPGNGNPRVRPLRWGLVPPGTKDTAIGNRMINARS